MLQNKNRKLMHSKDWELKFPDTNNQLQGSPKFMVSNDESQKCLTVMVKDPRTGLPFLQTLAKGVITSFDPVHQRTLTESTVMFPLYTPKEGTRFAIYQPDHAPGIG